MSEEVLTERAIRAIILDFGGVITQSEVSEAQLQRYDASLGLPAGTLRTKLHSGEVWELASTGQIAPEVYWERTGHPFEALLPPEFGVFRTGVFRAEPISETMVQLAQDLRRNYRLALCSNALLDLQEILDERPDIRDLFEVVVISALVGIRKPAPEILELTAGRLGVPVEACLLVDDKPRNTAAAEAIGMQAIVFRSADQLAGELAARGLLPREDAARAQ
jgi:FMN phosphatase YigB (HAD superfamily)